MAIYSFYDNHCDQFDDQLQLFENDENSPKYDNVAAAASSFDDEELLTIKSWLLVIGSNAKGVTLNVTVTLSGYCSIAKHDDNNNKHNMHHHTKIQVCSLSHTNLYCMIVNKQ